MRGRLALAVVVGLIASMMFAGAAVARIRIQKIVYDPAGPDYTSQEQLNDEIVVIHNTGNRARNLRRWKLVDTDGHRFVFPDINIGPDRYLRVHTGSGNNNPGDVYWDQGNFVWDNDGDTARLRNRDGDSVDQCSYSGGESPNPPKYC